MEKLPKAKYSPEFREQAVRTYKESGLSVVVRLPSDCVAQVVAEQLSARGLTENGVKRKPSSIEGRLAAFDSNAAFGSAHGGVNLGLQ